MFNTIRPYITKDEPFGPIDSGDIDSTDLKALLMLFETHNWIYKNLRSRFGAPCFPLLFRLF